MPDSGEQETLHCKALYGFYFIKPLLSRTEVVIYFFSTVKATQRGKQNNKTDKYAPNEITSKNHNRTYKQKRNK